MNKKRIWFGGIALSLVLSLVGLWLYFRFSDCDIESQLSSTNKRYVALVLYDMGGGGPGWCNSAVSVLPSYEASLPMAIAFAIRNTVFKGPCNASLLLEWSNDNTLKVIYGLGKSSGYDPIQKMESKDRGKTINIKYEKKA